jgi:hypothetical protein
MLTTACVAPGAAFRRRHESVGTVSGRHRAERKSRAGLPRLGSDRIAGAFSPSRRSAVSVHPNFGRAAVDGAKYRRRYPLPLQVSLGCPTCRRISEEMFVRYRLPFLATVGADCRNAASPSVGLHDGGTNELRRRRSTACNNDAVMKDRDSTGCRDADHYRRALRLSRRRTTVLPSEPEHRRYIQYIVLVFDFGYGN